MVLSFGMLGIVGVQAFALQSNREARLQSHAVNLARELADLRALCEGVRDTFTAQWNAALKELRPTAQPSRDAFAETGEVGHWRTFRVAADRRAGERPGGPPRATRPLRFVGQATTARAAPCLI